MVNCPRLSVSFSQGIFWDPLVTSEAGQQHCSAPDWLGWLCWWRLCSCEQIDLLRADASGDVGDMYPLVI